MEHLIHLVMIMLVVAFLLWHSFNNIWVNLIVASLSALSMIAVQPLLLTTSKTDISAVMSNQGLLTEISLLILLEMALMIFWCFLGFAKTPSRLEKILKWYPGFFILPILWYVQAQAIFYSPGVDFKLIAYSSAIFAFLIMAVGPYLFRWLIPESELRKELLFIIAVIVILLASVAPAQGTPLFPQTLHPEWNGLLALLALTAILAFSGFLCKRFNIKLPDISRIFLLKHKSKIPNKLIRKQ